MMEVAASKFARNFGRYREAAQREPVAVTAHDHITGYFLSAHDFAEYQRLKAMAATALSVAEIDAETAAQLESVTMDASHADLDRLLD
jgi:PHD/YefM family antitoxin component YafN of YafNO toxin-antitoxin module